MALASWTFSSMVRSSSTKLYLRNKWSDLGCLKVGHIWGFCAVLANSFILGPWKEKPTAINLVVMIRVPYNYIVLLVWVELLETKGPPFSSFYHNNFNWKFDRGVLSFGCINFRCQWTTPAYFGPYTEIIVNVC